jgi:hypothetical protein
MTAVLPSTEDLVDGGELSGEADPAPYLLGLTDHAEPATRARPASPGHVDRIRTTVVSRLRSVPRSPYTCPSAQ